MVRVYLMSKVLVSLGVALGGPFADAEVAEGEILGAPARLEGPLDVLLLVAAAAEPVGAAAGTVAAMAIHEVSTCKTASVVTSCAYACVQVNMRCWHAAMLMYLRVRAGQQGSCSVLGSCTLTAEVSGASANKHVAECGMFPKCISSFRCHAR